MHEEAGGRWLLSMQSPRRRGENLRDVGRAGEAHATLLCVVDSIQGRVNAGGGPPGVRGARGTTTTETTASGKIWGVRRWHRRPARSSP